MEIRDIGIRSLDIPEINTWVLTAPQSLPPTVPVTQNIGVPVVDIPGCVVAHPQDRGKNGELSTDDENGARVFCDGSIPAFDPINFNAEDHIQTPKAPVPPYKAPPAIPETPEIPVDRAVTVKCPTEAQELKEPVGTLVDDGTKKIVEYRLVGKECIPVKEDIKIPDQIVQAIPSAGAITTTASIAVVATTSALLAKPLADLLLRVVKPVTKKVLKKIAALRGKKTQVESLKERRGQQRLRNKAIRTLKGRG
jgi:hypothetical protein